MSGSAAAVKKHMRRTQAEPRTSLFGGFKQHLLGSIKRVGELRVCVESEVPPTPNYSFLLVSLEKKNLKQATRQKHEGTCATSVGVSQQLFFPSPPPPPGKEKQETKKQITIQSRPLKKRVPYNPPPPQGFPLKPPQNGAPKKPDTPRKSGWTPCSMRKPRLKHRAAQPSLERSRSSQPGAQVICSGPWRSAWRRVGRGMGRIRPARPGDFFDIYDTPSSFRAFFLRDFGLL